MKGPEAENSGSRHKLPEELAFSSIPVAFTHGTGLSIYKDLLLPAILNARHEIVLTTCFWAASEILDELVLTLKQLSSRVEERADAASIKVYICFSSRSATQKLFHTSSPDGFVYPPDKWSRKLGLPPPEELPGLDITVKSLFFRPFSVLHSKYLIVDRRIVFLPSCNVSWEDWYECAIGLKGPIVGHVFDFWKEIWRPVGLRDPLTEKWIYNHTYPTAAQVRISEPKSVESKILPHPHNSSLQQSLWFLPDDAPSCPTSPLTSTLVHLITSAEKEVVILTPNFTSQQAFTAVCSALANGVYIHLITNRRMMMAEQLATAGALTEQFIDRLIKEYRRDFTGRRIQKKLEKLRNCIAPSIPAEAAKLGGMKISYFRQPRQIPTPSRGVGHNSTSSTNGSTRFGIASYATKSHVKLTLVDRKAIVLGSGNMDRASWKTSQELGVVIHDDTELGHSSSIVENMWKEVEKGLEGCLETYFDG